MKERKIEVKINEDGSLEIDADGFTGDACIKEIEDMIGDISMTKEIEKKPEYYKKTKKTSRQYISQGGQR